MRSVILTVLYAVVLTAAWVATEGPGAPEPPRERERRPWATLLALLLVGVPSLVQLTMAPRLLPALQRAPGELGQGQLWRLVTSLVVQDGGWPGTVFNLVELAFFGVLAERAWGFARWWIVWLVGGVGAQFWGLMVQPVGGGNSVATFGLAASLSVVTVVSGSGVARLSAWMFLLVGLVLLLARDVHGGGALLGAVAGAACLRPPAVHPSPAGGSGRIGKGSLTSRPLAGQHVPHDKQT